MLSQSQRAGRHSTAAHTALNEIQHATDRRGLSPEAVKFAISFLVVAVLADIAAGDFLDPRSKALFDA